MFDIVTVRPGADEEGERDDGLDLCVGTEQLDLIDRLDRAHASAAASLREMFRVIAALDRSGEAWEQEGYLDLAHWLAARFGISIWAASRWITAAHALEHLPGIERAFGSGVLSVDKVVELCRFATPETEHKLITWAKKVSARAIRQRAERELAPELDETQNAERCRYLSWWRNDDSTLGLMGCLPADQGAVVARTLDRVAESLARSPEDSGGEDVFGNDLDRDARRADALVLMCSQQLASERDQDRATVVVRAELDVLVDKSKSCELDDGAVIHPEVARRLACDGRLQTVATDAHKQTVGIGRTSRVVPPWLARELRYRDRGCAFPGCGTTRYLSAHHIKHWIEGGRTDLDNLTLLCGFHHKLVHEFCWKVRLLAWGETEWRRPNGEIYDPVPAPSEIGERAPPDALAFDLAS